METFKCEVCRAEFNDKKMLTRHLKKEHKLTAQEYYDKYLKVGNEDKCPVCGKPNKFLNMWDGYRKHCSTRCSSLDKKTQEKSKATCLEKYGVEYSFQSEEMRNKSKETLLKKYGVEYIGASKEIQEKTRNTFLEKYGVDNPWKSKEVQEKIKATNLERYGAEYIGASEEIQDKVKQTNIERYGSNSPFCNKDVQNKIKATNLERYGVNNAAKSEEIKKRMSDTVKEIYGTEWYTQTKEFKEKSKETSIKNYGTEHPAQSQEVQDKIKATNLEKYGVEYTLSLPEIQEQIRQTNLEKYGVENPFQLEEIKQKIKENNLEKYGVEYPIQSEEIQEKIRRNNLEKYGVEHTFQVEEFRNKAKTTNLERYGAENPFGSLEIQEQIRQTNINKYGTPYPTQSEEIKQKTINTNLKKYGVEYPLQLLEIQEQIKKTNLEKYGVEHIGASEEIQDKIKATNLEKYGVNCIFELPEMRERISKTNLEKYGVLYPAQSHFTNVDDLYNLEEFLATHSQEYNCIDLAKYFNMALTTLRAKIIRSGLQEHIKDFYTLSQPEIEFKNLLDENVPNLNYIMHDRSLISPLELDFYFPEQKLAIEISPTYTHQYIDNTNNNYIGVTEKDYHYNKFKACEEKGVELITVFDWEDTDKVIDLIRNKLAPSNNRIYARKCKINIVDSITKEHKEFLDNYHVLGRINNKKDSFVIELLYNNEIVGIAVYYPYRKTKLELKRLAFKENYTVVGGASKLIKNAITHKPDAKGIITFSDNNLGTGSVYNTIGFKLIEDNKYSLTYYNIEYDWSVKDTSLWMVGADRLLSNFPGYEQVGIGDNLPKNDEIVMSYGFMPVYDCGYRKWEYILKNK